MEKQVLVIDFCHVSSFRTHDNICRVKKVYINAQKTLEYYVKKFQHVKKSSGTSYLSWKLICAYSCLTMSIYIDLALSPSVHPST